MPEGEQVWSLSAVRDLAGRVEDCAADLTDPARLLADVAIGPDDGAGGAVSAALADFVEAAGSALHLQQIRLTALARTVEDGVVTVQEVDAANADGVLGALRRWLPGGAGGTTPASADPTAPETRR